MNNCKCDSNAYKKDDLYSTNIIRMDYGECIAASKCGCCKGGCGKSCGCKGTEHRPIPCSCRPADFCATNYFSPCCCHCEHGAPTCPPASPCPSQQPSACCCECEPCFLPCCPSLIAGPTGPAGPAGRTGPIGATVATAPVVLGKCNHFIFCKASTIWLA